MVIRHAGTPMARAAWTKSRSRRARYCARARRPKPTHRVMPMKKASFQTLTPNTVMNSRAARMVGTIWNSSNSRSVTQSKTPPNQPAMIPMGRPMTRPTRGAPMATVIDVRAPQMARVKVSRPMLVGAEQVVPAGAGEHGGQVDRGVFEGGDVRGQDPHQQDHHGHDAGHQGQSVAAVAVPGRVPEAGTGPAPGRASARPRERRSPRHPLEADPGVDEHVGDIGQDEADAPQDGHYQHQGHDQAGSPGAGWRW